MDFSPHLLNTAGCCIPKSKKREKEKEKKKYISNESLIH